MVLSLLARKVRAWEQLHDPEYAGRLEMSDYYSLLLEAGVGEREAQEAANERGRARLSAGLLM